MYSTKPAPNYRTTVQVHGPSNSVNGFLGASSMAYLGKTGADFVTSDSQLVYTSLVQKLVSAQQFSVTGLDAYCKFKSGSTLFSKPEASGSFNVGSLTADTPYEVSGESRDFYQIMVGSGARYISKNALIECLTQAMVNTQLGPLSVIAVNNWWSKQQQAGRVSISWAENLSRNNYANNDFAQAVGDIVKNDLRPLVKASAWFKGWGLV